MKFYHLLPLAFLLAQEALAGNTFPGLRQIMTEAEWKRAGLEQLTPDEIGVIDAAVIRHLRAMARETSASAPSPAPVAPPAPEREPTPAELAAARSRQWASFGKTAPEDWRSQEPMVANVTGWRGSNGFVLDNGQVWEGVEEIPFDALGRSVTIEARPMGAYAMKLTNGSVVVRVRRVQ